MKMSKKAVGVILVWVVFATLFSMQIQQVKANGVWLPGWGYRKSHVINPTAGAGSNYQIGIKTYYGSGTDGTENVNSLLMGKVYLNSHSQTDFDDVRFTDNDKTTLLDYWLETKTDSDFAIFWVEIADSLSSSPVTIYIYYGNDGVGSVSDGDNTFIFFDHFPGAALDGAWDSALTGGQGSIVVENSLCKITSGVTMGFKSWIATFSLVSQSNMAIESLVMSNGSIHVYNWAGCIRRTSVFNDDEKAFGYRYDIGASDFAYHCSDDFGNHQLAAYTGFSRDQLWHRTSTKRTTTTYDKLAIDNTQVTGLYYAPFEPNRKLLFYSAAAGGQGTINVDWVAIRKYYETEPSHGAFGAEELHITNLDVTISDMVASNWVFAEEQYYHFVARVKDDDPIDTVKIAFNDTYNWVNATYDNVEDIWSLEAGEDVALLRTGSESTSGNITSFIFPIYFKNTIIDCLDVDIWLWANNTNGEECDWTLGALDYFNIYHLGGQALDSLVIVGDAGRLTGGDVFDFYARNGSSVEASIIYRNLQHVKFLNDMFFNIYYTGYNLTYGMDYWVAGDNDFTEGWRVDIATVSLAYEATFVWQDFTLHWFNRGEWVKTENISCIHGPGAAQGANTTSKLWVDLWFNTVNASTTIGARVNAYEFPMTDSSPWWYRWFSTNWGPDPRYGQTKTLFTNLLDGNNDTISAKQIELVRLNVKLDVWELELGASYVTVSHPQIFDKTFAPITQPFQGVQTPAIDETLIPKVTQRGIVGAIWSAFRWLGDSLGRALGPSVLGFWNTFVGFLDTIAAAMGFPNLFTNLITWINNLWIYVASYITDLFTFLTSMFLIWMEGGYKAISTFSQMVTYWILMFQQGIYVLDTGYGSAVGLWEMLGLTNWLILFAILYPVFLLGIWEEEGFDVFLSHIQFIINMIAFVVHGLITITMFFVNIVHYIIESIPWIE